MHSYLIDGLQELTDNQRHRLDTLDLFLGMQILLFQIALLIFNVLLLDLKELQRLLQFLEKERRRIIG